MRKNDFKRVEKADRALIVTTSWDDGQKADIKLAGLLTKYGIKGTFYVTKSYYDPSPLTPKEIVEIDREHEIGSHTLNHVNLLKVPVFEAKSEIEGSKIYLEELLGHRIKMFCYPYGRYNDSIKELVKKAGFIGARTCNPSVFNGPEDFYEWHITLPVFNGSPLTTLRLWMLHRLPVRSLLDWEIRAKILFDLALERGGVFHMWGHGVELEVNNEWDKIERVLDYIAHRKSVHYMTNGEVIGR